MASFFNKSSWATSELPTGLTDFYHRSSHLYSDIVAEDERENSCSDSPSSQIQNNLQNTNTTMSNDDVPITHHAHIAGSSANTHITTGCHITRNPIYKSSLGDAKSGILPVASMKVFSGPASTKNEWNVTMSTKDTSISQIVLDNSCDESQSDEEFPELSLGDVQKAWCEKQVLDPTVASTVFLTWQGKRLFDVTTCKSLGVLPLAPGSSGEVGDLQVHMEAVTPEAFEDLRNNVLKEQQLEDEVDTSLNMSIPDHIICVTLRSTCCEEFRLKVATASQVCLIIQLFCDAMSIPSDKAIMLYFDGECLNPEDMIKNTEIADLDCIDVMIK
ncbi:hypothetical protein LOZ12_006748 [Ophidiomyces ophidiicola]|nr:hypothetical protein LOZ62_006599 [Ophidiomyces ophidiicola]KAI1947056.1 hypothetical protein LOZ59_006682 [Ophidiomyces ophidiicola]KAI2017658.1 hypothetical protein LOZ45_006187 [Ophidiomyces ophidiicola]KAI2018645.1 hypothetical protein LOZ48_006760 [Ophidiomyces ophidiicola]KAI2030381.1 hypothetical protein LOZ47_006493 [Ophidiomyces ophidiicola]